MSTFDGDKFVDILKDALGAKNQSDLAQRLGVTSAAISSLKGKKSPGERQIANFIEKAISHKAGKAFEGAISPIVEFYPVEIYKPNKSDYFFDYHKHPNLRKELSEKQGIYSFYNSEGKIIYLGQTKNNLFSEMNQTFRRKFEKYILYKACHGAAAFDLSKKPKISRVGGNLAETASYFSAYEVLEDLIDPLEAFSIRLIPNNIVNSRIDELSKKA